MTTHPLHTSRPGDGPAPDDVVLLDDSARPCGRAARRDVHTEDTPLHLAFSFHALDSQGRTLLTRRALTKAAWPGVWSNACCGHPRPDEPIEDAVRRRVFEELGAQVETLTCALPQFRYRAVDASGVVENEVCPVFVGSLRGSVDPDPGEVMEYSWAPWASVRATAASAPALISPWSVLQYAQLPASVENPLFAPAPNRG
ncbi:isopentenyl-diphosphate Delta-isomerase [Gephyromycinifex aptenodytis]|uniref:isopentenyl-diphosphate Delta-isomerase n=1 Tax=Gephyromycinifex aptenodytis TaxID=2716227 RepID=UPI001D02D847|nr:isopentenyl-diphosphate Delta-isomerase [Gephyromycinifex aptenodytis]